MWALRDDGNRNWVKYWKTSFMLKSKNVPKGEQVVYKDVIEVMAVSQGTQADVVQAEVTRVNVEHEAYLTLVGEVVDEELEKELATHVSPRKTAAPKAKSQKKKKKREALYRYQALPVATVQAMLLPFTRTTWDCEPCTVIDPFMGTGSTGIAARSLGCYFIGIDNDEHTEYAWQVT